ncbi:MAG TPA: glycosyltransferase family 4 protein [Solirubrobacteraceae bacterium]|nr:glycosyltransferase family 4 protein [Solirubrobacteraceae bacterium]
MSAATQAKPVLFVTGHAPAYRTGAFAELHEREHVQFALFGGRLKHGGGSTATDLPFPHLHVSEQAAYELAASGRYRAVVCSTGGRVALPAGWAGARRARVPLILWCSLWAHPRTPAHAASYLALRRLYRSADALVTYGPHVSAYVRAYGARNVHVAPQAVDNAFWSSDDVSPPNGSDWPTNANTKFLFAGRPAREKGLGVLFEAWSMSGLQAPTAALVLVGTGPSPPWVPAGGAVAGFEAVPASKLRDFYAASDVLVVPSIATRSFREPWGLVVNEAMNQGLTVIASDAVGAAAGGLVRNGHNGAIVPAGDPIALAATMRKLAGDADERRQLGAAGRRDVAAYDFKAWAAGFADALASVGCSRGGVR